jgi:hypothetical protein
MALEKEAAELRATTAFLTSGTHLPARLMEAVAAHCPDGVVVEGLEIGWERSIVRGVCVEPHLADRLAGALEQEVAAERRRVTPGVKRLQTEGANAGLYKFELEVAPSLPSQLPKPQGGPQ